MLKITETLIIQTIFATLYYYVFIKILTYSKYYVNYHLHLQFHFIDILMDFHKIPLDSVHQNNLKK